MNATYDDGNSTELKGVMEKLKTQMSEANARGDAHLLNDLRMEQKVSLACTISSLHHSFNRINDI
jgi:hypothetical protein